MRLTVLLRSRLWLLSVTMFTATGCEPRVTTPVHREPHVVRIGEGNAQEFFTGHVEPRSVNVSKVPIGNNPGGDVRVTRLAAQLKVTCKQVGTVVVAYRLQATGDPDSLSIQCIADDTGAGR